MRFEEFLGQVQNRCRLDSLQRALTVTRITLTTLSERIQPGEAKDLASQLPMEIGRFLTDVDSVESFDWQEFVDRIVERGNYDDSDRADAVYHARVVMDVVAESTSPGELADLRAQLPDDQDFDELFELVDQEGDVSRNE